MTATYETRADIVEWVNNPDDPQFRRAMRNTCEVCGAKPNRPCWNTIDDAAPLPGRLIHHARRYPKSKSKDNDE